MPLYESPVPILHRGRDIAYEDVLKLLSLLFDVLLKVFVRCAAVV